MRVEGAAVEPPLDDVAGILEVGLEVAIEFVAQVLHLEGSGRLKVVENILISLGV